MNYPAEVDVSVLILFFNRPDHLERVFDAVRRARPSRLFLYQDGPRSQKDVPLMQQCRDIVNDIDWQCEVQRNYQTQNQGCDPSEYLAQKWAFSISDKCIVLEDDDVPSLSFFSFCKEMLDRYENDERITMIAGFNSDEVTPGVEDDYFFTSVFSIWGWASWRRVVDKWDASYSFMDDRQTMVRLQGVMKQRSYWKGMLELCEKHRASGIAHYETIFWSSMVLNSGLAITPTRNMINNLGSEGESTHYGGSLAAMPRRVRQMFTMKRYDVNFPLRHPKYVIENVGYKESVYRTYAYGHPMIKISRSMEELVLNLRYGNFKFICKSVRNRLRKWGIM